MSKALPRSEENRFEEKIWIQNRVKLVTPANNTLFLLHDLKKEVLYLYNFIDDKQIETVEEVQLLWTGKSSKTSESKDDSEEKATGKPRVFIEWCQPTSGKYHYFDIFACVQHVQRPYLSIKDLTGDLKPHFDESAYKNIFCVCIRCNDFFLNKKANALDTMLSPDDTLILSPIRSIGMEGEHSANKKGHKTKENEDDNIEIGSNSFAGSQLLYTNFTDMGTYNGHKLYLGGSPSLQFVKTHEISFLLNCRVDKNPADIVKLCQKGELLFDVATWKYRAHDNYFEAYQKIDDIVERIHQELAIGHAFIHCLAGAHRSPFITGCYLAKYAGMKDKGSHAIYRHMQHLRAIVQPLGYNHNIDLYIDFLNGKIPKKMFCITSSNNREQYFFKNKSFQLTVCLLIQLEHVNWNLRKMKLLRFYLQVVLFLLKTVEEKAQLIID
ncbi:hypothetical protein RFI_06403 [Reticulomyxa filosa]|uniref:Tyrosine specific protein phosphatases domain-containing protein n=1 Tax=Reticulomyxa filosa TaxID=46433 RepID=X6NY13_RETFI|nr:hypothetical protein RFI_06403 [Reticulomyxa filosa]|eukprot:ETO30719.1 hypothetical protein RFI_06403 [Reticulomyxa filosa]